MRKTKFKPQDFEPRPIVPCAHTDCAEPATIRVKLSTGWANLCKKHDLFHNQLEANEFCERNGLFTREQKIAWILKKLRSPRPTPYEHWMSTMKTPGLIPQAYEMARNYLERRKREDTNDPQGGVK